MTQDPPVLGNIEEKVISNSNYSEVRISEGNGENLIGNDTELFDSIFTPSNNHKQTYLTKLYLENFMSFEKAQIIFHPSYNIISGPNGSGKSSILHAIKFVLGSNDYDGRYRKWAEFIQFSKKYAIVRAEITAPSGIFIFERYIDRNQKFTSKIQTPEHMKLHPISQNKIKKVLAELAINPDNVFSFMSQGNIEQIQNLKSTELAEFIEKGAGIHEIRKQIFYQREEVDNLLTQNQVLESKRRNIDFELQELQPKLQMLKEKRQYTQKINELKKEQISAQFAENLQKLSVLEEKFACKSEDLVMVSQQLTEMEQKREQKIYIQKKIQGNLDESTEKLTEIKVELSEISAKISNHNEFQIKLSKDMDIAEGEIKDCIRQIKQFEVKHATSQLAYQELSQEILINNKTLNTISEEEKEINHSFTSHRLLIEQIKNKEEILENRESFLKNIIDEIAKNNTEIDEIGADIIKFQNQLGKFSWFLRNPNDSIEADLRTEYQQHSSRLRELTDFVEKSEKEIALLEAEHDRLSQKIIDKDVRKPKAIEQMLQEIRNRKLPAVGPFMDFISYDQIYHEAVLSALGSRVLYSFIAKDKDTFYRLSTIRKQSNANCNIYLPEKVNNSKKQFESPPNRDILGLLADKITPIRFPETITIIIDSVASNFIVVKDNQTAVEYLQQYQPFETIITLAGEQIKRRRFILESRPFTKSWGQNITNIAQAKLRLHSIQEEIDSKFENLQSNKKEIAKLGAQLEKTKEKLDQIQSLLHIFHRMTIKSTQKKTRLDKLKEYHRKKEEENKKIQMIRNEMEILQNNFPKDLQKLQDRIAAILIQKDTIVKNLEEYNSRSQRLHDDLIKLEIQKDTYEKQLHSHQNQVKSIRDQLKNFDHTFLELINCKNEIADKQDEIQISIQKMKDEQNRALEIIKEFDLEIKGAIIKKVDLKNQTDIISEELKNLKQVIEAIRKDISEISLPQLNHRPISDINRDIESITEKIRYYWNIPDNLEDEISRLKKQAERVDDEKHSIFSHISQAKEAINELESAYTDRFKNLTHSLENSMNEKFKNTRLNIQVKLTLTGGVFNPEIQIHSQVKQNRQISSCPITGLSGGQRAMLAIFLMISLIDLNPSPLCIYDECDSFLDLENNEIFAELVQLTTKSGNQIITIMPSKNESLYKFADHVIGITRLGDEGASSVIYSSYSKSFSMGEL